MVIRIRPRPLNEDTTGRTIVRGVIDHAPSRLIGAQWSGYRDGWTSRWLGILDML